MVLAYATYIAAPYVTLWLLIIIAMVLFFAPRIAFYVWRRRHPRPPLPPPPKTMEQVIKEHENNIGWAIRGKYH